MATGPPHRYFQVLVNHRAQYGIWPLDDAVPGGWSPIGFVSTREECLVQVAELWRDMRPAGKPDEDGGGAAGWTGRVAAAAAARPGAVALSGGARLTYGELLEGARRLAGRLIALGIGAEDRVALYLPLGAAALTALLGIALTGAAYLPIDSLDDAGWRDLVIADGGVRAVVTDRADTLVHVDAHVLTWPDDTGTDTGTGIAALDAGADAGAVITAGDEVVGAAATTVAAATMAGPAATGRSAAPVRGPRVLPSDAACVLYHPAERGSRGVVLEHRQLDALLGEVLPVRPGDRVAVSGRLSSEFVNADLLRVLHGGAEAVLPPDAAGATDTAGDTGGTGYTGGTGDVRARPPAPTCSSRFYGSLETGVVCAGRRALPAGPGPARTLIGPPFAGCRLYALDDDLRPLAVGGTGSLYVGGPVVARGYLDDPAATVDRFLPDPFAADGSRMFATGHRVRLLEEGVPERLDG
ncbi:thioester reductase [Planomonospora sphaerica]|uniref:Thioester reductase n=1 Tax=Planomonospora sphaerica TaxID=161355 RepID=A0A171DNN2_9ACTN|nr:AMP-binding protein [Planomonospora sphaerica]GAT70668.1 thioester reductase [Planomonospora sphaerica]